MPSIGAVSVAPLAACSALSTWDWSALTDAWSAASCALDAPPASSWESRAWSPARVAWAWATCATSVGELMTARAWPAVTRWPTVAYTSVTWPAALKLSVLVDAGSMVPVEESVWRMVVMVAGTRRYDGPAEAVGQPTGGGRDQPAGLTATAAATLGSTWIAPANSEPKSAGTTSTFWPGCGAWSISPSPR
jgi:hypothetical protein